MSGAASFLEADAADERRAALRALLADAFVDAADPAHTLVRRHERELARTCADLLGYRLEVGSTAARLVKAPTASGLERGVRVRPASATGRARPRDEWPLLSDRGAVVLFLALAALERGGVQTAVAELARAVRDAGADAEPSIAIDFTARAERLAFADALDVLCHWGVLVHVSGSHLSYRRAEDQGEDEALLTVDRRRLALLLRDPCAALDAVGLDDLLDDGESYAPTPEGERRRRAHRLARRLVEDPALLLDELDEEERAYFLGQRPRLETEIAAVTGMVVERRAEGSAAIDAGRQLTDIAFPARATVKQLALLLCDTLAAAGPERILPPEELRETVRMLMGRHREHWDRDPADPVEVTRLLDGAADVLCALGLASREPGGLRPRPPCARFRSPTVRAPGALG